MGKLTCAITGYRPSRFRFKYNENNKDCKRIKRRMEEQFSLLYQKGVHHFIVGGTLGVDMWAGEILLAMKEKSEFSEIKLTIALPFEGYDVDWDRVSRERKNQIQKQAEVLVIGKEPGTPSYTKRNHFTSPREKQSMQRLSCEDSTDGCTRTDTRATTSCRGTSVWLGAGHTHGENLMRRCKRCQRKSRRTLRQRLANAIAPDFSSWSRRLRSWRRRNDMKSGWSRQSLF